MVFFGFNLSVPFWHDSESLYAFDSTPIDLCLWLFAWGQFRFRKSAVKLHRLLDLRRFSLSAFTLLSLLLLDILGIDLLSKRHGVHGFGWVPLLLFSEGEPIVHGRRDRIDIQSGS